MMISRKDGAALEPSHADSRLRDFQAQLQMVPGITAILSAWGDEHTSSFPEYIADKGRLARMTLFLKAIGSEKGDELLTRLQSEASHSLGRDYQVDFSGTFYHVIRDSNHLVERQVKSFGLSLCLALIAVGVLFKSFRLMLMAFVPNVIPIAWSIGLMVLLDIPLSTGTAMIASVTIGIALDDTIYYLASLQAKKGEGTLREALTLTTVRTGRALLISSVVLALGFWCGCLGSFMPTIYFALLTGITMLSALLCDLIILPACLVITEAGWVQRRAEERNTGGCVSESS
jgi:predicted RND superfamily exporter protein